MALPHILLSELEKKSQTGYDISCILIRTPHGRYWRASHQQIYRDLNKMLENKLVTVRLVPQVGKPDRKIYSITKLGRVELSEWLSSPPELPTFRDEMASRIMAAKGEDIPGLIESLLEMENECEKYLDVVTENRKMIDEADISKFEKTKFKIMFNRAEEHWLSFYNWSVETRQLLVL
ncbi:putative Transcriptional regulator PadR family [Vibrio coralliirubri]|uniref:PadR family transcriptional regulator n=1 Tax=Vibrio coralliirubri TaxID=1516159 RepID=UPI00062FF29A|nr:PadR family transcriptional regulator [Vibrio coralliirubri]CDT54032.1 putative Transcriptional regulator PadR family [Vibrio coralliirubri]